MERARFVEKLSIADIHVGERMRRLDAARVSVLAESMKTLGLQTPISIVYRDGVKVDDGEPVDGVPCLVAGLHRLEAAKALGWKEIDAWELEASDTDVRRWEIAENLHRSELSALERDEHVAEWVRLTAQKVTQVVSPGGKQPREHGIRKAASELGVNREDVRRAVKTAALPDEAKEAAREAGLDNNRSALLRAAAAENPVVELDRIKREREAAEAARKNRNVDRSIKLSAADDYAAWLLERIPAGELDTLISWIEAAKPADVIAALRRNAA